jgi:uncharacterized protein (TIGR01244 family)
MLGLIKIDDNVTVSSQIRPEDVAEFAKQGFAAIINNRPDNEEPGQPPGSAIETEAKKHGLAYYHIPVVGAQIGYDDVVAHQKAMLRGTPALAFCRSGTRCYVLWALSRVLFDGESPLMLVADAVRKGYDIRALPALVEKIEAERAARP